MTPMANIGEPRVVERVEGAEDPLVITTRAAFARALRDESALHPGVFEIPGMSGRRYRHLIHNLIGALPSPRYLEIGCWAGSTLCSAVAGHRVDAVGIDNWSEFGGPAELCKANIARFRGAEATVRLIEADYREVDYTQLGVFDVYLFDGPHAAADHEDAIRRTLPAMASRWVFIVDDWNWREVRMGTHLALGALGLRALYTLEIRTSMDNTQPTHNGSASDWHNGYLVMVLTRG